MHDQLRTHARLSALAARQHGVVSHRQLHTLGYGKDAIFHQARAGRLIRIHRGVYAVGHARLTAHGHSLAAVMACGPEALLSHRSAAWLWDLFPTCPSTPEVTVPTRGHRKRSLRLHSAPSLTPADRAIREHIPVTSLPRTLLDLAAVVPRRLERALEQAERLGLFDLAAIDSLLARVPGHRGVRPLRSALAVHRPTAFTRSELERMFLGLVRKASLPTPSVNAFIAGHEVDMLWMDHGLVVELDGFEHHRSRAAFERDRERDEELKLSGLDVVRFTARRVRADPAGVASALASLLARSRS